MDSYIYEDHVIKDPLLPFFVLRDFVYPLQNYSPNWHENIEILYCYDGDGYVKCGLEDYHITSGDIFIANSNTPHRVHTQTSVSYHGLIIDNSFCIANGFSVTQLHFQELIRDEALVADFLNILDVYDRYDASALCAVADIRYAVLGFLRALCSRYVTSMGPSSTSASCENVKKALTYIRKNMADSITLNKLADHVGISKFYLSREFKAYTSMSVIQAVKLIRCSEAKRLIEGGMSVSAAAAFCGFDNLSYFTRSFKDIYHVTPSSITRK